MSFVMTNSVLRPKTLHGSQSRRAFTLVELLVVIAIIGVLSSILLPALARSRERARGIVCLNNAKQLMLGWMNYADDHGGRLAYNLGAGSTNSFLGPDPMSLNWANNVLNWDLSSDNTNAAKLTASGLGPYLSGTANAYRCPSDHVLSTVQQSAGWTERVRSYSMNAMVGDAGSFSQTGQNVNNPDYIQFFQLTSIPRPENVFVFLDEHPDSIDDGYFLNQSESYQWHDLPASYHDGSASFSFADGHSEKHRWRAATTRPAARPGAAGLPIQLPKTPSDLKNEFADFNWLISKMSIERNPQEYHY
jgi:prepilin-type N-terminal cleavage/methylation domain-containing protein/prepilin-type processing-associated H-X9-DG protein